MKKITSGMTDATGTYNKNRGHLSDGVIGLALLQRQPGFRAGLDHFGFKVESPDNTNKDLEALASAFPECGQRKIAIGRDGPVRQKNLEACKMCRVPLSDPDGVLLDLSD